jgi:hypothetical protein
VITANGVLAGAEIAVVSVRKTRIQTLLDTGRSGAKALATLRGDPERFLAARNVAEGREESAEIIPPQRPTEPPAMGGIA